MRSTQRWIPGAASESPRIRQPASVRLAPLSIYLPEGRIGYIRGSGDSVAEDLAHIERVLQKAEQVRQRPGVERRALLGVSQRGNIEGLPFFVLGGGGAADFDRLADVAHVARERVGGGRPPRWSRP